MSCVQKHATSGQRLILPCFGLVMHMQHSKVPNNILYGLIWIMVSDCCLLMGYWRWPACSPRSWTLSTRVHGYREGNCQKEQFSDQGQLPGLRRNPGGGSQVLHVLCAADGKKHLCYLFGCQSMVTMAKGFPRQRVSCSLGGLEGGRSSWSSCKILCIKDPLEENLEDLHHLSM